MTSVPLEQTRPSDAERDRALAVLRDGAGSGRLSHDTFIRRMNFVLRAQSRGELADAIRDLPSTEPRRGWIKNLRTRLPRLKVERPAPPNARTAAHPHDSAQRPASAHAPARRSATAHDPTLGPGTAYGSVHAAGTAHGPAGWPESAAYPERVAQPTPSRGARFDPVGVIASWLDAFPRFSLVRVQTAVPLPGLALPAPGSPTVRIGRGAGATLRMADESVSRHHAELRHVDEGWMLRDLGSMNGTTVNDLRITTTVRVRPGDRVSFGAVAYVLTWTD
ncbi:FHA domain-containing protein [Kribbella soli]